MQRITAHVTGTLPTNMTAEQAKAILQAAIDGAARAGIENVKAVLTVSQPQQVVTPTGN